MAGNRTAKTLENGTATDTGHDDASRLLSVDHRLGVASFQRFGYVLNAVGNRTSRTETTGPTAHLDAYGYDAIDQVTQVQYGSDPVNATTQRQLTVTTPTAPAAAVGRAADKVNLGSRSLVKDTR